MPTLLPVVSATPGGLGWTWGSTQKKFWAGHSIEMPWRFSDCETFVPCDGHGHASLVKRPA